MKIRAMQALVVVLNQQLPVRAHVVDDAAAETEVRHPPLLELGGQIGQLRQQRLWVARRG